MALEFWKVHLTHIIVAFIWMIGLVAVNAIEFYFNKEIRGMDLFWIVIQNAVIGSGNAYWLVKTHINPHSVEINPEEV